MKIVIDDLDLSKFDKAFITQELKNSKELRLELFYKSIFTNTGTIRNLVSFICDELGLESSMKFKIVLIVDELNNNAIEYGSKSEDVNIMRFSVLKNINEYYLNIEVEDSGKGNEHKKAYELVDIGKIKLKEGFNNHSSIRGRGLFLIIKNIVNELYFKDSKNGGLIVGVNKKIKI